MNTIFIIIIIVYLKKLHYKYNIAFLTWAQAHDCRYENHFQEPKRAFLKSQHPLAPPSTPNLIKNQQYFQHVSSLMIKWMSQLYKKIKNNILGTSLYFIVLYISTISFALPWASAIRGSEIIILGIRKQLHKMWFVPRHTAHKGLWQDAYSGFGILHMFIYTKLSLLSKVFNQAEEVDNGVA